MNDATPTFATATFASKTRPEDIPEQVVKRGVQAILDGLGCMVAGSSATCGTIVQQWAKQFDNGTDATIIGTAQRASSRLAALANGTAGHALDYDDTQLSSDPTRAYGLLTHPTIPPLAAALALAERHPTAGRDFLTAVVLGVEVSCKIAEAIDPQHYLRGFHSTGTIGMFGATVTAGRLLDLGPDQLSYALGIAASIPTGIRANFGTMMKPLHAGRAAENGIWASQLALLGYTSDPNALDGRWGFLTVAGGEDSRPHKIMEGLGNPYTFSNPGVSIKPYPCGSLSHPTMDAFLDLVRGDNLTVEDVETVTIRAGANIIDPLRYTQPTNELQAKFSLQFVIAILLLRRRAGLQEFRDEVVQQAEVQELMPRVHVVRDQEIETHGLDRMRSEIEVRLKDGRQLTQTGLVSRGSPERPMTDDEIADKFRECAHGVLTEEQTEQALAGIFRLSELEDVSSIITLLQPNSMPGSKKFGRQEIR